MIKQVFIKGMSIILMSAIMGSSLVGCGKSNDPNLKEQNEKIRELEEKVEELSKNQETNKNNSNEISNTSKEELRKLNIFLSNFSEVDFSNFSKDNYNEEQLIQFAIVNQLANNYDTAFESYTYSDGDNRMGISASTVQSTIDKYFGFTVKNQSTQYYEYYNGAYILPLASGEMYPDFSKVKEIYREGNNLRIIAEIYRPEKFDDVADNSWRYEPMDRVSDFNKDLYFVGNVEATVKVVNDNGIQRYKLLEYKVNK